MATFGSFVAGQVLTAAELNGAGTWSDYTPSWTQSATITKTVNWARYSQFNKIVLGSVKMTATSAGTANNKILIGLPVTASSNNLVIGTALVMDESTANDAWYSWTAVYETSSTMSFTTNDGSGMASGLRMGQSGTNWLPETIASGDVIYIQFMYEAA